VLGNHEADALVIKYPEKAGITDDAILVAISNGSDCADLEAGADCFFKNSLVGSGRRFSGNRENVPLTTDESGGLNILWAGIQTRGRPVLSDRATLGQITAEGLYNCDVGTRVYERQPDEAMPLSVIKRPLDVSQDNSRSMSCNEFLPRKIELFFAGLPEFVSRLPQGPCKPSDSDARKRRDGDAKRVKSLTDLNDEEWHQAIGGAGSLAGLCAVFAYLAPGSVK
jgi:hypothetical protein